MEYNVKIPDESYSIVEFIQEDLPGVASINTSLVDFDPKIVFSWHLSVMVALLNANKEGLPAESEGRIVDAFEDVLIDRLGQDTRKPNGLFLARITWNSTTELIWRVHHPEPVNRDLQKMLKQQSYQRKFDYRIDHDPEWKLANWHLGHFKSTTDQADIR